MPEEAESHQPQPTAEDEQTATYDPGEEEEDSEHPKYRAHVMKKKAAASVGSLSSCLHDRSSPRSRRFHSSLVRKCG